MTSVCNYCTCIQIVHVVVRGRATRSNTATTLPGHVPHHSERQRNVPGRHEEHLQSASHHPQEIRPEGELKAQIYAYTCTMDCKTYTVILMSSASGVNRAARGERQGEGQRSANLQRQRLHQRAHAHPDRRREQGATNGQHPGRRAGTVAGPHC